MTDTPLTAEAFLRQRGVTAGPRDGYILPVHIEGLMNLLTDFAALKVADMQQEREALTQAAQQAAAVLIFLKAEGLQTEHTTLSLLDESFRTQFVAAQQALAALEKAGVTP